MTSLDYIQVDPKVNKNLLNFEHYIANYSLEKVGLKCTQAMTTTTKNETSDNLYQRTAYYLNVQKPVVLCRIIIVIDAWNLACYRSVKKSDKLKSTIYYDTKK